MAWREKLYERRLKRPWTPGRSSAIRSEFHRRRHEIPVPTELHEHPAKPEMTIKTKWLSFIVQFSKETLTVDAELSLAAKMLATDREPPGRRAVHRQHRQRPEPLTPADSSETRRTGPSDDGLSTMNQTIRHHAASERGSSSGPSRASEPLTPETPRFHVFLIDTGWNGPVSKVLHEQHARCSTNTIPRTRSTS